MGKVPICLSNRDKNKNWGISSFFIETLKSLFKQAQCGLRLRNIGLKGVQTPIFLSVGMEVEYENCFNSN